MQALGIKTQLSLHSPSCLTHALAIHPFRGKHKRVTNRSFLRPCQNQLLCSCKAPELTSRSARQSSLHIDKCWNVASLETAPARFNQCCSRPCYHSWTRSQMIEKNGIRRKPYEPKLLRHPQADKVHMFRSVANLASMSHATYSYTSSLFCLR